MDKLVKRIRRFNDGRDPERLAMKYRNMRSSPFVFLRATCHLFHDRLPDAAVLRKAPAAWICGDLHLENFGSYRGENRLVYFDINDLDEAVLAPATWDLVRFVASLIVGRDSLRVDRDGALALGRRFIDAYADALSAGQARWVERETAPSPVRELLTDLRKRSRAAFLDGRTVRKGKRRLIKADGRKALPASSKQHDAVRALMARFAAGEPNPDFYEVLDVARRISGNGSLGLDRYVILVRGKGTVDTHDLLDLKQAAPSSLAGHTPMAQPKWADEAQRIVAIQRRVQAVPVAFLHEVQLHRQAYVLRDLQPSQDRAALAASEPDPGRAERLLTVMGQIVAWAQLRSSGRQGSAIADALIDFGARRKWRAELQAAAREAAAQVQDDWQAYAAAYDDGAFAL